MKILKLLFKDSMLQSLKTMYLVLDTLKESLFSLNHTETFSSSSSNDFFITSKSCLKFYKKWCHRQKGYRIRLLNLEDHLCTTKTKLDKITWGHGRIQLRVCPLIYNL